MNSQSDVTGEGSPYGGATCYSCTLVVGPSAPLAWQDKVNVHLHRRRRRAHRENAQARAGHEVEATVSTQQDFCKRIVVPPIGPICQAVPAAGCRAIGPSPRNLMAVALLAFVFAAVACAEPEPPTEMTRDRETLDDCLISLIAELRTEEREELRSATVGHATLFLYHRPTFSLLCGLNDQSRLGEVLARKGLATLPDRKELLARAVQHRLRGVPFDFEAEAEEVRGLSERFERRLRRGPGGQSGEKR